MKERLIKMSGTQNKELVKTTSEQEKKADKLYRVIACSLSFMLESLRKGTLSEEMKQCHLSLAEHYVKDFCDLFGYEGILKKQFEERHGEIRALNLQNRELREQLGRKVSNEDLRERCKNISEVVRKWWNIEGFGHMSESWFDSYGHYHTKLSGYLCESHYGNDGEKRGSKKVKLAEMGFDLDKEDGGSRVIDNDKNRKLLIDFLRSRFQSVETRECQSISYRNHPPTMQDIEIVIVDMDDIGDLTDKGNEI